MQTTSFHFGPTQTPKSIKWLILANICISLLSPLLSFLLFHFFHLSGPLEWLPLSRWGIEKGAYWQLLTYGFVQSTGVDVTLSLLFSLAFQQLLLWFSGSALCERLGSFRFFVLYFSATLIGGLAALAIFFLFPSPPLVGSLPAIFCLLVAWVMMYQNLQLTFFFFLRWQAKWIILILIGLSLLFQVIDKQWAATSAQIAGALWGYVVGYFFLKSSQKKPWKSKGEVNKKQSSDDEDAFMDRMLDKIAQKGLHSLSPRERQRMEDISRKKNHRP